MTCDEAEILLHALIDGELDAGHAREVEAHLATCAKCAADSRCKRHTPEGYVSGVSPVCHTGPWSRGSSAWVWSMWIIASNCSASRVWK